MRSKTVIHEGAAIRYHVAGDGPTTLVMLHGWRSSSAAWNPLAELLERSGRFVLVMIDLPGFGESERPLRPYGLKDYAAAVLAVMDCEGMLSPWVIGHSFGARVASYMAAAHPKRVDKLFLAGSGGVRRKAREFMARLASFMRPLFAPRFMRSLRALIYRMLGAEDYVETPELKETFVRVINENMDGIFPRIASDTVVIWGDRDGEAPLSYGRRIAAVVPRAKLEIIPNAGHYAWLDAPQAFADIILNE